MRIIFNGEERDATPEEEAEILASQQAVQQPQEPPVSLQTIAGACFLPGISRSPR